MGWWAHGNDTLGDRPADILERALREIGDGRRAADRRLPSWSELLGSVAFILSSDPTAYLGEVGQERLSMLTAIFDSDVVPLVVGPSAGAEDLVSALENAFVDIASVYEASVHRGPRLSEILTTFVFILAVDQERYLADPRRRVRSILVSLSGTPIRPHVSSQENDVEAARESRAFRRVERPVHMGVLEPSRESAHAHGMVVQGVGARAGVALDADAGGPADRE